MRRVLSSVTVMFGLVVVGLPGAAFAAPGPAPVGARAAAPAGAKVCTITDERMIELSGLVATDDGFVAINDSSDDPARRRVFFLDNACEVKETKPYPSMPRDPEDLGLARDGKLYIADIGDNDKSRSTVALWTMPADGSAAPVINRLTYPDGKHDAEALLFNGDGTPIIVTREAGKAGLYSPTGPLQPDTREGVPMTKLGEVTWPKTSTVNEFLPGPLAQLMITGGATSPDGHRVTLRTYSDAFEWDVTDGDVVAALTKGKPRSTPLPGEPRGESITYSRDGVSYLTVSETADQPQGTQPEIRRYTPSRQAAKPQPAAAASRAKEPSWFDQLTLRDISYLVAAVGVLGALLLAAGVFGILRARRNPPADPDFEAGRGGKPGGPDDKGQVPAAMPADSYWGSGNGLGDRRPADQRSGDARRPGGAVYGGGASGGVYGGRAGRPGSGAPSGGRPAGSVYGGARSGGGGTGGGRSGGSAGAVYGGRYTDDERRGTARLADKVGYAGEGYGERPNGTGPGRRADDWFAR